MQYNFGNISQESTRREDTSKVKCKLKLKFTVILIYQINLFSSSLKANSTTKQERDHLPTKFASLCHHLL